MLYNTCTVRENANTRVYGRIGYPLRGKRFDLADNILRFSAPLSSPDIRNNAVAAEIVAAVHNIYPGLKPELQLARKKKQGDENRALRLHDAGGSCCRKNPEKLPFCRSDIRLIWHPNVIVAQKSGRPKRLDSARTYSRHFAMK